MLPDHQISPYAVLVTTSPNPLDRVRALCLAYPETEERISHGEPTWFVKGKVFVMFANNHHNDGRIAIWCAAAPGAQDALTTSDATHYFVPPYVGYRGWLGVRVDLDLPLADLEDVIEEAYRAVAPKRLLTLL